MSGQHGFEYLDIVKLKTCVLLLVLLHHPQYLGHIERSGRPNFHGSQSQIILMHAVFTALASVDFTN